MEEMEKAFNIASIIPAIIEQHQYALFNFENVTIEERKKIAQELVKKEGTIEVVEFFKGGEYDAGIRFRVRAKKDDFPVYETKKHGEIERLLKETNGIDKRSVAMRYKSNPNLMSYPRTP